VRHGPVDHARTQANEALVICPPGPSLPDPRPIARTERAREGSSARQQERAGSGPSCGPAQVPRHGQDETETVRRWLGDGAEARRAQYGKISNVSVALLYALACSGMVIVYLVVLTACKPAEPPSNTPPAVSPSQGTDYRMPEPVRCGDRPALEPVESEDPRLLP
jgi:hypothetical protein